MAVGHPVISEVAVKEGVGAISVIDDYSCGIGTVADPHPKHADVFAQVKVQSYHELTYGVVDKVLASAVL